MKKVKTLSMSEGDRRMAAVHRGWPERGDYDIWGQYDKTTKILYCRVNSGEGFRQTNCQTVI